MLENNEIDIKENYIKQLSDDLLSILLKDRSSGKNVIWATDDYISKGPGYQSYEPLTINAVTGRYGSVIRPRIDKSKKEQQYRLKDKAEVFTPSWICNKMANAIDEDWFERANVFNIENELAWQTNEDKIVFTENNTWQDYVNRKCLEITCGEAPFLVSRYDTTTGQWIDVKDRIGVLDRKLRVINENIDSEKEWVDWVFKAYKATYGYEWQGDSLLIARENLLFTFIDYYEDKFKNFPINEYLIELAKILSWNIWQMDGLKYVIPNSCKPIPKMQMSLFDFLGEPEDAEEECPGCVKNNKDLHTGIYCKIMNWDTNRSIIFNKGVKKMKFDFVIGNPPYQQESAGTKKADDSLYHYFMDAAYEISDRVEMITPSKFLFNNGNTPVAWNKKMLSDEHFKVIYFEPVASKVFANVSFKGGVAIHYRDKNKNFGAIGQFTEFSELNSILIKVKKLKEQSITTIIYNQNKFDLDNLYRDYPNLKTQISSEGREKRLTSGCLKYECFKNSKEEENDIQILGVINNKRNDKENKKYIAKKYLEDSSPNLNKYKVIVPANNGSGALGEVLTTPLIGEPLIGEPLIGYTQTFIGFGAEDTIETATAIFKYVKTKFARVMLGILKITQNGKKEMWEYVPLQNFTNNSDIDWSKNIHEIDLQLYKKYGLDDNEINFIETHVQEMK